MVRFRPLWMLAMALVCAATFCAPASAQLEKRITTRLLHQPGYAGMAVGDFNHDGKLDVVAVAKDVQIFLGNGDGTFQAPINYVVGDNPNSVAVADFNGDGEFDLAVTNFLSTTVSILFGNGDGTFQPPTMLNTLTSPQSIRAADFNGDGKPDLVLLDADLSSAYISIFLNNGDGTFSGPINNKLKNATSAFAVGDFDRNGTLDLAVAEEISFSPYIGILLGNGDGTFTQGRTNPGPTHCQSIAVGDFRRDGRLDLVATDYLGTYMNVFLGNGDGTFQPPVFYASISSNWATVADFNGDGRPDLLVSNLSGNGYPGGSVSILLGNGDGTFQPQMVFPSNKDTFSVAAGDFNGDHQIDVIALDSSVDELVTLLNTGAATFSPTSPLQFPTQLIGTTSSPLSAMLTNSGTAAMTVSSVKVSGGPFEVTKNTCTGSLAPGAQCAMSAIFTAQAKGLVNGTLTIRDSASSKPQVVQLIGTGTVVGLSPPHLNFPPQKVGTKSAPQSIQLINTGSVTLNLTSFPFINGSNYNDFSESNDCALQMGPSASCTITVRFSPRGKGLRSAFVEIEDDGGGTPQRAKIVGTGN